MCILAAVMHSALQGLAFSRASSSFQALARLPLLMNCAQG